MIGNLNANAVFFPKEFIMVLLLLFLAIFILTILIRKMLRKKYIKELMLAKITYQNLYKELSEEKLKELPASHYSKELIEMFDSIKENIDKAYAMTASFHEERIKKTETKELGFIVSYNNDMIENEQNRVVEWKEKLYLVLESNNHEVKNNLDNKKEKIKKAGESMNMNEDKDNTMMDLVDVEIEQSYFAKGLIIEGNVLIDSSLILKGEIRGNLLCKGAVTMSEGAMVNGDLTAEFLHLENGKIMGEVKTNNDVIMGKETFVKGDIFAKSLEINGSVEGDITASIEVSLLEEAKILGNVNAMCIDMEKGAKVVGKMNIGETESIEVNDINNTQ